MTPLAYFLTFVTDAQAQEAARQTLTFLLLGGAVWLYFFAIEWTGERLALAAEEQRRMDDLEWYVAVAQYLELRERNAKKGRIPTNEFESQPFALDAFPADDDNDELLLRRLSKSVEITRRDNDAA